MLDLLFWACTVELKPMVLQLQSSNATVIHLHCSRVDNDSVMTAHEVRPPICMEVEELLFNYT